MPTYHYRCSKCEQHLEIVQSMSDDPITECAVCGGEMQKVLKPVGIVLKGSGFYRTDNRSSSKSSTSPRSDSKGDSSKSSDSKSSDSKSGDSKSGDSKSSGGSSTKAEAKSA